MKTKSNERKRGDFNDDAIIPIKVFLYLWICLKFKLITFLGIQQERILSAGQMRTWCIANEHPSISHLWQ